MAIMVDAIEANMIRYSKGSYQYERIEHSAGIRMQFEVAFRIAVKLGRLDCNMHHNPILTPGLRCAHG